jgi:hypothetical protein
VRQLRANDKLTTETTSSDALSADPASQGVVGLQSVQLPICAVCPHSAKAHAAYALRNRSSVISGLQLNRTAGEMRPMPLLT